MIQEVGAVAEQQELAKETCDNDEIHTITSIENEDSDRAQADGVLKTIKNEVFGISAPQSEEQLNDVVSRLWGYRDSMKLIVYYKTGEVIVRYQEKHSDYGAKKIEKLADMIGAKPSTLYKIRQFAEKYTEEQVDQLLRGSFTVSWRNIAQNLKISAEQLLDIYQGSKTQAEFYNAVAEFKHPRLQGADQAPNKESGDNDSPQDRKEADSNDPGGNDRAPSDVDVASSDKDADATNSSLEGGPVESSVTVEVLTKAEDDDTRNEHMIENDTSESTMAEDEQPQSSGSDSVPAIKSLPEDPNVLMNQIGELEDIIKEKDQQLAEKDQRIIELQIELDELRDAVKYYEKELEDAFDSKSNGNKGEMHSFGYRLTVIP